MLKIKINKPCLLKLTLQNGINVLCSKPKLIFFSINVIGRIFKWLRYLNVMEFILPVYAKPVMFFNTNTVNFFLKNGKIFLILNSQVNYSYILQKLFYVKKPSIFNKRGLNIYNRIYYKKKGKITSYITNK